MSYCNQQNLIDRGLETELLQLTNVGNPDGVTINVTVLNQAIADAGSWMNGFIAAYLPLAAIPENFEAIACDETMYRLYRGARNIPDAVKDAHNENTAYLKSIQNGSIAIAPDSGGAVDAPQSGFAVFESASSVFGRDSY